MSDQISKFCAVLVGLACLLVATSGVAQITNAPREDFWVPDGVINAMVVTNGVAYVGGDFRYVGPDSGGGVGLDLTTGQPVVNLPRVEGAVYAMASDGQGGRYLGGLFSMVGGLPRRNLAHILADGSVDTQWVPDAIGLGVIGEKEGVHALAVSDGLVYVGGLFNNIAGVARNNLAAVDAITGIATSWSPSPNDDVLCLDVVREVGKVVIGGKFTVIGGQARSYLAAVDTAGTGAATSWFPNPNAPVLAMARLGDTLYVAGTFTALNNGQVPRSGIAAVNVYTGAATPWAPQANAPVQSLAVTCGNGCAGDGSVCSTVFAAGGFTSIGGLNRTYVAALDPFSGAALGWNANISLEISFVGGVSAMLAQGDTIYLGGRFSTVSGQPRSGAVALDSDTARLKPWSPSAGGIVNALNVSGNSLFVGGKTISVGGQARRSLAAIDTATGRLTDWNPTASGVVNALTFNNNVIYIGGTFTNIGGLGRNNLAAVGTNGVTTAWNPNADSTVYALAVGANGIYAGGQFWFIGGTYHPGLTYLDFATGTPAPSGFAAYYSYIIGQGYYPGVVYALTVSGSTLFVGGQFIYAGDLGSPGFHPGIAALNAITGQDANISFPGSYDASGQQIGTVYSLSAFNGTLYAGGNFAFIGNASRSGIAELNPATGVATAWNPSANGPVYSLAPAGTDLYVGGTFSSIGGQTRNNLAAINRTTGLANGWDPSASSFVLSLGMSSSPNQLLAGGDFLFLGPRHHVGLGAFPLIGSPTIAIQPVSQTVPAGTVVQLFVQASGNGVLGYQWRFNGTNISGTTSSNLQLSNTSINDTGAYDVRVNNSLGQVVSSPARIVFYTPAAIVTDPVSQDVQPTGQPVVLSVGVTGSPAPTFQWRRNGVNIPGQNLASLTLNGPQSTDGGNFDVVVSNPGGSVKSQVARVRVGFQQQPGFTDGLADQRTVYTTASGLQFGNNASATRESGEPKHAGKLGTNSVWMSWSPQADGVVTFTTSGSTFDTLLAAYMGSSFANLVPVASDDDRGGFGTSKMKFAVVHGQVYSIAVDGLGGSTGDIVLTWNLNNQISPFVPQIINQPVSQTGTQNQDVTFSVQALAGQSPFPLSYYWLQNCAAIFFATNSTLTVTNPGPAQAGAYRVLIFNGYYTVLSEPAYLEFGPDPLAVSSDKFEDLIADITPPSPSLQSDGRPRKSTFTSVSAGIPGTQIFNNFGASTQPGEPLIAGVAGGSSRWFTLRPNTNGTLIIDTVGSVIDTLLGVYRGPSIFSLTNIASDNNGAPDGIRSRVVFSALKNVDYFIAVDGVGGQQGNIAMNWKLGFTPAVTASLTNQYVTRGNGVTFLSSITGSAPLYYQWLSNGVPILNATNSSLVLSNVQPSYTANYSLSVSNLFGMTNTVAATLTVRDQMMFSPTNPASVSGGQIQFRVLNILGMNKVVLEASTNLVNWVPIKTNNTPPGNFLDLTDPVLGTRPYRFYRTKEQ